MILTENFFNNLLIRKDIDLKFSVVNFESISSIMSTKFSKLFDITSPKGMLCNYCVKNFATF